MTTEFPLPDEALIVLRDAIAYVAPNKVMIQSMARELLYRREEAKGNDHYIEDLERRLSPCTCQSGKCWQHDD